MATLLVIAGLYLALATAAFSIAVEQMVIYPVLSAGAPGSAAQTPLGADKGLTTPVDKHPNSVKAAAQVTS